MDSTQLQELIAKRRAIFPNAYIDKEIPKVLIQEILENANWAPNHRNTEPWRFKVFMGESRNALSDFLAKDYKDRTPSEKFSDMKYKKTAKKPLQSACVIAICMQRDPEACVPEWEEIAATSCAVQNMWLTCTAHDIGCYWSTPSLSAAAHSFFQLKEGERYLGLFYMGYHNMPSIQGNRTPIDAKIDWR